MASGDGISGIAVALVTGGGVLLYAGFQGLDPLQALKDITTGKTKPLEAGTVSWSNQPGRIGKKLPDRGAQTGAGGGLAGGTHPEIAAAAQRHAGEKYSQARRWQSGFSDCSSFVGKALKDCGITPPVGSVTASYMTWRQLKTISRSEVGAGDILCGSGHVAIALSPTTAIGMQSSRTNVRTDTINNIMYGQTSWSPRRYVGTSSSGGSPGTVAT